MVKIKAKPVSPNILQIYAPITDHADVVEEFYGMTEQAKKQCTNHEVAIIMVDMNAKVGDERQDDMLGPFDLGNKNNRGI